MLCSNSPTPTSAVCIMETSLAPSPIASVVTPSSSFTACRYHGVARQQSTAEQRRASDMNGATSPDRRSRMYVRVRPSTTSARVPISMAVQLLSRHEMQQPIPLRKQGSRVSDIDGSFGLVPREHPDHDAGVQQRSDGARHVLLQPVLHACCSYQTYVDPRGSTQRVAPGSCRKRPAQLSLRASELKRLRPLCRRLSQILQLEETT
ncbi:hypothetical protein HW555_002428 [Spodoptera exigua]|uniref:Uncharacterized protein n=1 Tax=Spodoptera exigua TaxID=7107 RepID=A0A835GPT4_SPOEX|nr:hypothetical protein HW555_002428 [Spodoptera exigua]